MISRVSIVLLVALFAVSASGASLRADNSVFMELKALDSTQMGRNVLNVVHSRMAAGNPVTAVLDALQEIKDALDAESRQAELDKDADQQWYDETVQILDDAILNQKAVIQTAQDVQAQKAADKIVKQAEIDQKQVEIEANEANKLKATRDREITAEVFECNINDHVTAINLLNDLIGHLGEGWVDSLPNPDTETLAEHYGFTKQEDGSHVLTHGLTREQLEHEERRFNQHQNSVGVDTFNTPPPPPPPPPSFMQMSSEGGRFDARRIQSILERIIAALERSKREFEEDERVSIATFDALWADLERQFQTLTEEKNNLEADLATTCAEYDAAVALEQATQIELNDTEALLEQTHNDKAAKDAHYRAEKDRRDEEIATVRRVEELIDEHLGNLAGYLHDRISEEIEGDGISDEHKWTAATNKENAIKQGHDLGEGHAGEVVNDAGELVFGEDGTVLGNEEGLNNAGSPAEDFGNQP